MAVKVADFEIGSGAPLALVAGPCVIEPGDALQRTADALAELAVRLDISVVLKASSEKDNRSSAESYRGPGLERGLELLRRAGEASGLPLTSDVHRVEDVKAAAAVLDLIQVPALLCRQTSLLEAVGAAGKPVNVKKGQFASTKLMAGARDKLRAAGAPGVLFTERGTFFGYDQLVADTLNVPRLRALGCPVIFDAGHAAANATEIPTLARAGVAAGADALFIEVHPDPEAALCDGQRMLALDQLEALVREVKDIAAATRARG
ncbi:MAG: 3-deoxy-8-phosphooctulonate synthase [Myxococcales bacterium]|nr:3-deoxy-8-phosphooctulonate synthase [Myxococcales bacterium]